MSGRKLLWISLSLNVLLGVLLFRQYRSGDTAPPPAQVTTPAGITNTLIQTNVVVRKQNLTWSEIESRDYPTFIANLRGFGCPDDTIRDIIIADVNHLYAQRRVDEIVTVDQQWWRSEPDTNTLAAAYAKQEALEQERRSLLTRLLGPGWESQANPNVAAFGSVNLTGGAFSTLSSEARETVKQLQQQAQDRVRQYLRERQAAGLPTDAAELARFSQRAREELARVLNPDQMDEYLLRYSTLANTLRNELRGMNLGPDEFRAIFKARDTFDQQLQQLAGLTDPVSERRRAELQEQRETAVAQAMGTERYAMHQLNQDPTFRQAQSVVRQFGGTPEQVLPLYEIQQATQQEIERIRGDNSISAEERDRLLLDVEAAQRKSLRDLLGEQVYERYQQARPRTP